MANPFNHALDNTLQGKYARVWDDEEYYEGWCEIVHHGRGSVILHDAVDADGNHFGSVFIRVAHRVAVLKPKKTIIHPEVTKLEPHPLHPMEFEPKRNIMRRCHRHQYAGGFPVVTQNNVILNGHKRLLAAERAGMRRHPCERVQVTETQAEELYKLAHPNQNPDEMDPAELNEELKPTD